MIKVLKTEADYEAALEAVESLIDLDPDPGTPEADRLELLTLLIQDYESQNSPMSLPDPIAAKGVRSKPRAVLYARLIEVADPDFVHSRVLRQLKDRKDWRSGERRTSDGD